MTKQKTLETAFSLIEAAVGDELYEYADNPTMVLATLAQVYGIIVSTREALEHIEPHEELLTTEKYLKYLEDMDNAKI